MHASCVPQWYEREFERAFLLHKVRALHDDTAALGRPDPGSPPPYLQQRVGAGLPLPQWCSEEQDGGELEATVWFVLSGLNEDLFRELGRGLGKRRQRGANTASAPQGPQP